MIIQRNGYGSNFNTLEIVDKTKIVKSCHNRYGNVKMQNEILFYKIIIQQKNPFCSYIPTIYKLNDMEYSIEMEFLENYKPLYLIFPLFTENEKIECLTNIQEILNNIHNIQIPVDNKIFKQDLHIETLQKINTIFNLRKYYIIFQIVYIVND
jgi:hypothetical protein